VAIVDGEQPAHVLARFGPRLLAPTFVLVRRKRGELARIAAGLRERKYDTVAGVAPVDRFAVEREHVVVRVRTLVEPGLKLESNFVGVSWLPQIIQAESCGAAVRALRRPHSQSG